MSDVDRLVREAEELGEEPRDYAIGLGLVRGRVDRWLRRHAEITAHASTSMFALSTAERVYLLAGTPPKVAGAGVTGGQEDRIVGGCRALGGAKWHRGHEALAGETAQ